MGTHALRGNENSDSGGISAISFGNQYRRLLGLATIGSSRACAGRCGCVSPHPELALARDFRRHTLSITGVSATAMRQSPRLIVVGHRYVAFGDFFRDAHHRVHSHLDLGDLRMHFLDEVVFDL